MQSHLRHFQGAPVMVANMGRHCTAFQGDRKLFEGPIAEVALTLKTLMDREPTASVLVFDDETGEQLDFDLRGSADDVLRRLQDSEPTNSEAIADASPPAPRGPGRPKLGVVAREVTLLPRHWEWLSAQPGGASVALRKLVEEARRTHAGRDRLRRAQEAAYRFLSAMAGNLPNFEEACRALFAGDRARFEPLIADWPPDIRDHATRLAGPALQRAEAV